MHMGGSCIGTWGQVPPPRFLESNVKSLIFTIGAPIFLCHLPPMCGMCMHYFKNSYCYDYLNAKTKC